MSISEPGTKNDVAVKEQAPELVKEQASESTFKNTLRLPSRAVEHRRNTRKEASPSNEVPKVDTSRTEGENVSDQQSESGGLATIYVTDLRKKTALELLNIAQEHNIEDAGSMSKQDLIFHIIKMKLANNIVIGEGLVEVLEDGFAFIRSPASNYITSSDDIYVSPGQVRRFSLRTGDIVTGEIRLPVRRDEKYLALTKLITINERNVSEGNRYITFDSLVPLYPDQQIILECDSCIRTYYDKKDISTRIIDIVSPLGRGQRALIVAPPKTGKTILLQNIAHAISVNYPEICLKVLLIDERPEEVTDMQRSVRGEVISSTFDEPAHRHVHLAELVISNARRLVECGKHVVLLVDSLTRLARACNAIAPSSGRVLTGGVDSTALQRAKRFFGSARNIENGGSLTILATTLVETGSKMDDVIFEEFKGTGNCEII